MKPSPSCLATCHRILYTTYYESINWDPFFGYYFFNSLLLLLQLLHVFWSCLILRMIHSFTKKGQVGPGEGGLTCAALEPLAQQPPASCPPCSPDGEGHSQ